MGGKSLAHFNMSIDGIEVLERTYTDGKEYWQTVSPDIDGMLGGFENLNIVDANDSKNILNKLIGEIRSSRKTGKLRALDCGAGKLYGFVNPQFKSI